LGPVRVHPGRLSVSRTFGDPHAKFERYGGNPDVVIAVPDITTMKIDREKHDFIVIASDGIYDRMSSEEVISLVWDQVSIIHETVHMPTVHELCGRGVERILRAAMQRGTSDNVSAIVIALPNFQDFLSKPNPLPPPLVYSRNNPSDSK
jgi:protein phosphatase 2C family protein 2/3